MPQEEAVIRVVAGLVAFGALYGGYRTVRRVVHFLDEAGATMLAISTAAPLMTEAMALIIHEFKANGGRLEHPIHNEREAQLSTIKDLALDTRALLHEIRGGQRKHDEAAEERVKQIVEAVAR